MKTIVVNENQRGFLFKNGKYVKMLGVGKYRLFGGKQIELSELDEISCASCPIEVLLKDNDVKKSVDVIDVKDNERVLRYRNGVFVGCVQGRGKHAFWNLNAKNEFKIIDLSDPQVKDDVPAYVFDMIPKYLYKKIEVAEYQKARLFIDQKLMKILDAGTYYFWSTEKYIDVDYVDTRLLQMNICGQEIMTQDKVSVRVNFVCNYRIVDYIKTLTEIDDYKEQMHVAAQLALRDYIGKNKLDDILISKEEMSEFVFRRLKEKEKELYVEIKDAGVKDIVLPGEIRDIMNTVLIAEKRAQANVITRREEVASTRSLLNTAKLMEENATLYKLKELEYVERICENVGNINLNGGGDILSQLAGMLKKAM